MGLHRRHLLGVHYSDEGCILVFPADLVCGYSGFRLGEIAMVIMIVDPDVVSR